MTANSSEAEDQREPAALQELQGAGDDQEQVDDQEQAGRTDRDGSGYLQAWRTTKNVSTSWSTSSASRQCHRRRQGRTSCRSPATASTTAASSSQFTSGM